MELDSLVLYSPKDHKDMDSDEAEHSDVKIHAVRVRVCCDSIIQSKIYYKT